MNDCLCVCHLLKSASQICERRMTSVIGSLEISHCQAQILLELLKKSASMSHVSRTLCCHKSNVTQVTEGLLKKGLISRTSSKKDKRSYELSLTPAGKTVALKIGGILAKEAKRCMCIFSDSEKATLSLLLTRYIEQMRSEA